MKRTTAMLLASLALATPALAAGHQHNPNSTVPAAKAEKTAKHAGKHHHAHKIEKKTEDSKKTM